MAILSLPEAKAALNLTSSSYDTELQPYIDATTEVIESFTGPVETRTITEEHDGGALLALREIPAQSLDSVTPILTGGEIYAVSDLDLSTSTGVVRRLDGGCFEGPLRVSYTAGRSSVPPAVGVAARVIVAHLWRTQLGSRFAQPGPADEMSEPLPGFGFAVPNRSLELLRPFFRPPSVG